MNYLDTCYLDDSRDTGRRRSHRTSAVIIHSEPVERLLRLKKKMYIKREKEIIHVSHVTRVLKRQ